MIHIVAPDNRALYAQQIDDMFALRYQYFVVERGWDLQHQNGRERDRYDGEHTVYLMRLNDDGGVLGAFRFMPTTDAYPMIRVVPAVLRGRWPEGPSVWEASRGMIRPEHRTFRMLAEFCTGIVEFALIWGIDRMMCTIDPDFLSLRPLVSVGMCTRLEICSSWMARSLCRPSCASGPTLCRRCAG